MSKVFLSYAGVDRAQASGVVEALRGRGLDVWWDQDGIGYGDRWRETLETALTECSAFLLLVGALGVRRWVRAEVDVALNRHFGTDTPLPIFPLLLPDAKPEALPPFLGGFQAARLPALDSADFESLAAAIREGVGAQADDERPCDPDVCPFPGLIAFDQSTARFFFGRQHETLDLLGLLGRRRDGVYRRWLHVHGASGSGKSSLVKAGLVPAVKAGWLGERDSDAPAARVWHVAELRPGKEPVLNLATGLARGLPARPGAGPWTTAAVHDALAGDEFGLRDLARDALPPGEALLLVVDQLEEVFTMAAAGDRERFDALLRAALEDDDGPLHLVSTIRDDFVRNFPGELPRLHALINARAEHYFLGPMDAAALHDAVETPRRRARLRWSEPGLAARIVEESVKEKGALFLVANLMRLLWERQRERGDCVLGATDYDDLGGVGGALARSADRLLDELGAEGKEHALRLLTALVQPGTEGGHARRTLRRDEALKAAGEGQPAEAALASLSASRTAGAPETAFGPRLVVVSTPDAGDDAPPTVDLAHEALLRTDPAGQPYWPTLHDRVEAERSRIEARQQLEAAARLWQDGLGELARDTALTYYREADAPTESARAYIDRSVEALEEAQRAERSRTRRTRIRWAAGVVSSVVLLVGAWLALLVYDWGKTNRLKFSAALGVQVAALPARFGFFVRKPQMVPVPPAGFPLTFRMGSEESEGGANNEQPTRTVNFPKPFGIGKYEVTFEEYDQFAAATWRRLLADQGSGRGRQPVINVSWEDARDYAAWLSEQTGAHYRLPTEAEWEYAARAGTTTPFSTGECIDGSQANFNDGAPFAYGDCPTTGTALERTVEVDRFAANAFGLHQMHGNVWEWTQDCWHDSYKGAPTDGSAWLEADAGNCGQRVLRGGSWPNNPRYLRSSYRDRSTPVHRTTDLGFRLAQDK